MNNKEYVGENKVKSRKEIDRSTPSGENLLEIEYDSGEKEIMSKRRFSTVMSFKKSDATTERNKLVKKISSEVYALMVEYGLKIDEINVVQDSVTKLVNDGLNKSTQILWGTELHNRNLLMMNDVLLRQYGKKEDNNGTTS